MPRRCSVERKRAHKNDIFAFLRGRILFFIIYLFFASHVCDKKKKIEHDYRSCESSGTKGF